MVALLLLLSVINDTEFSSGTNILGMPQDDKKRRDSKVRIKIKIQSESQYNKNKKP